jgi:low affinity Fe/Cu permease
LAPRQAVRVLTQLTVGAALALGRFSLLFLVLLTALGCRAIGPLREFGDKIEQRTTEGLTADQMFTYKSIIQNGREPSFDEKITWRDNLDLKIKEYLRSHPEDANSLLVSKFRFDRRATVGMSKEQIMILLGPPSEVTTDADRMQALARKYWPELHGNVTEAWIYPLGWNYYFTGERLRDITQFLQ